MDTSFTVTDFVSALLVKDKKGSVIEYNCRYAAAIIATRYGRIRFTCGDTVLYADKDHSVFLPQGINYVNECLDDAESIVINVLFLDGEHQPFQCRCIPFDEALEYYQALKSASSENLPVARCRIFEGVYALLGRMLENLEEHSGNPIIEKAILYMNNHFGESELTVSGVAEHCHVSEIYLRKLFRRELEISPHRKLTEIRMRKAHLLLREKRPVCETALSVGFSDVFQFSRAYKRFYGFSPSSTK